MKLECVLTACNNNPLYMNFIPYFIKAWRKLYPKVDIKIILISESIPSKYEKYSDNIILFTPLDDVCDVLTSQAIRMLYPALLDYQDAVLITDIDMIPMHSSYYSDCIKPFNSNQFVIYKDICRKYKQIMICYNAASPKVWSSIFLIKSLDDIKTFLIELNKVRIKLIENKNNKRYEWIIDQRLLFNRVKVWQESGGIVIGLNDKITNFKRMCRSKFKYLTDQIKGKIIKEEYMDYHCKRPFDKYEELNNEILKLLPQKVEDTEKK